MPHVREVLDAGLRNRGLRVGIPEEVSVRGCYESRPSGLSQVVHKRNGSPKNESLGLKTGI